LRLHADDPVDWYPWGDEAFAVARERDVPIFLSIGYSSCHWCHVMEEESFEDPEVAALMNRTFVSVKVDREERPDIDQVYMTTCQFLGARCGWPLNVLITPEGEPFFATTYVPKSTRFGRRGMLELVPEIAQVWTEQREEVVRQAAEITKELQGIAATGAGGADLGRAELDQAYLALAGRYDRERGGFGAAPKFPSPHQLTFLLRYGPEAGEARATSMAVHTLRALRRGGIYDQVGLGFHRYSTDAEWRLPHFEKMLYDQAMLALAYIEGHQATGDPEFALVAREIFAYLLRDMRSPEGAFYSAEDADSEGEEGVFYVWSEAQLRAALGGDAEWAIEVFGALPEGNVADEATGTRSGANVLRLAAPAAEGVDGAQGSETAAVEGVDPNADDAPGGSSQPTVAPGDPRLEAVRRRLLAARAGRERPLRDDKVLADWNGLMIAALARASVVLDERSYARTASTAASFVLGEMRGADGRLLHRWHEGNAGVHGTLDDHAFMTWGLLELYEATFDARWLEEALALTGDMLDHFDDGAGGFYLTADDAEALIVRSREIYDGALPSGNSVAMMNLLRLARLTGNTSLEARAAAVGRAFADRVARGPSGHAQLMQAVAFATGDSWEVVIAGERGAEDTDEMLDALRGAYVPHKVVHLRPSNQAEPAIDRLANYTEYLVADDGRATAYVCQDFICNQPTTDPETMLAMLRGEVGIGAEQE
jgi:hypothetical protein